MKRSDIPSLDDLRAFEVVARLGSVRAAAHVLSLTHGAVSRRVGNLARAIDVDLVMSRGRGIAITADGEALARATTQAFALIDETLQSIRATDNSRPVVFSCERSLAMRWLISRLGDFQLNNPDCPVHLSVGGGSLDFHRDGVGLALRRLDFPLDPDWVVEPLFDEETGPVMHPDLEKDFRLGTYTALMSRTRMDAWPDWYKQHPEFHRTGETLTMDHHFLTIEAAINRLGIAMCPAVLAIDDIRAGRLVAPLGFSPDGTRYGLIHTRNNVNSVALNRLKTWIHHQIELTFDGSVTAA